MNTKKLKTTEQISKQMRKLSNKRSKVESVLAKALWHKGYRYRLNYSGLPGTPDIVLTKYKIVIFVDGEFWHGKDFEKNKGKIHNNNEYWIDKIKKNIQRDIKNDSLLRQMGWIPLHFWSRDVKKYTDYCVEEIEQIIHDTLPYFK